MRLGDGLELGALAAVEHTPSVRRDSNTQEESGLYWKNVTVSGKGKWEGEV